jgi:hypothetical protein
VRLVAGALERADIATVVVGTMRGMLSGLPRVLITRYQRGSNFGPAADRAEHLAIAREALGLFDVTEPTFRNHQPT